MYKYKVYSIKRKGNIIIYVVLIGFLLMLLSLIMLRLQMERSYELHQEVMKLNESTTEKNQKINLGREELLSGLYEQIKENKSISNKALLTEYLKDNFPKAGAKSNAEGFKLWYDDDNDYVVLQYSVEDHTICSEYYVISFQNGSLRFKLLNKEVE